MNHLDQEAELYALGMLDDAERTRVDEHIAACDTCLQRVGSAEASVAALVDSTQRAPAVRPARWPQALAACFALATFGLIGHAFVQRGELDRDGALFATLVDSHFEHAQFVSPQGAALPAKAIYERHGKWFQIIAGGAPDWHVTFVRPNGARDPAAEHFTRRGAASMLMSAPLTPVSTIELDDAAGHLVGTVKTNLSE